MDACPPDKGDKGVAVVAAARVVARAGPQAGGAGAPASAADAHDAEVAQLRAQLAAAGAERDAALAAMRDEHHAVLAAVRAERDVAIAGAEAVRAEFARAQAVEHRERDALLRERGRLLARMALPGVRRALLAELLIDALALVAAAGYAVEVSHLRALCGATLRRGVRRADGTLDEEGFKGGTADMMVQSLRLQVPWAEAARKKGREGRKGGLGSMTQLMRAANDGDVVCVRQLVQFGVPLDLVDEYGRSALYWACDKGHAAVAEALLDGKFEGRGAAIDLQSKGGWTALMWASSDGHEGVVRLLLARGANVALHNSMTALGWAKWYGRAAVVALLEAAGAPE